jgi:pimeloyl-ACP methyl ester carboxylesterase
MSNNLSWIGEVQSLGQTYRIYCVEIPGEPGLSADNRHTLASPEPEHWLGQVLDGLGLAGALFGSMSLGSWYSLRFATRHPDRVRGMFLLSTGGVAPARADFLPKVLLYSLLGPWGRKQLDRLVWHKTDIPMSVREFGALVQAHFRPLLEPLPLFDDAELQRLTMPVLYLGGLKDSLLDTAGTARRLQALVPQVQLRLLEDTGHLIIDQGATIRSFLAGHA